MFSSVRSLARSLLMFTALVLLIATLIQPATFSHAQEDEPPPSPTAGPPPGEQPAVAPSAGVALKGEPTPNNAAAVPAGTSREPVQPAAPTTDSAPVLDSSSSTTTPAQSKPQATQPPNTFHVNIIASARAYADGLLTYTIYYTNTAPTTYQNVILQNAIGGGQEYLDCDDKATCPFTYTGTLPRPTIIDPFSGGNYGARQVTWSLGTVASGQYGRISYTVRVWRDLFPQTDRPSQVLGNTVALYDGGAINPDRKLNEDQWGVLVVGPIFYLTKTVDKAAALQRDEVSYTITLGNKTNPQDSAREDAEAGRNIQLWDVLPPHLDHTTVVASNNGRVEQQAGAYRVVWDPIPSLAVGATVTRQFTARIKDTLTECTPVDNDKYYVTSDDIPKNDQGIRYPIQGRNNAQTYVFAPAALDIQVATSGTIYVGNTVSYVVNAKNYWNTAINNVTVRVYLPSAFTFVPNSAPGGTYIPASHTIEWTGVNLPVKADFNTPGLRQLTFQARAGRVIDGPPPNRAYAEFEKVTFGSIPTGCLRSAERGVDVQPLLYATKTVATPNSSTWVLSGTDVIYTVELLNISSNALTNVTLIDSIPNPRGGPFLFKGMVSGTPPTSVTSSQVRWDANLTVPGGTLSAPGRTILRFTMTARGLPDECRDNRIYPDSPVSMARDVGGGTVCIAFPWIVTKTVDRIAVDPRTDNRTLRFTLTYESLVSTDVNMIPKDEFDRTKFTFRGMVQGPNPINTIPDQNNWINWSPVVLHGRETITYIFDMDLPPGSGGVIPTGIYCNRGILWPNEPQYTYYVYTRPDACTVVSSIELHVVKRLDRRDVGLGELVTYSIELNNISDSTVTQLVVSDTLPVNVMYVKPANGSLPPTITELPDGRQRLRWENVLVPERGNTTISFQARAPALIGDYTNEAEVSGGSPTPAFRCDKFTNSGGCIGLVELHVYNLVTIDPLPTPANAQPGDTITYSVSLVSNNNIPYVNTTVTDTLPLGFTFVEMVTGPVPYRPRPDVLVWNNQTIPPRDGNNAGRLTYVFKAKAPLSYGSFRSRVEASSPTGTIPTVDNAGRVLISPPNPALSLVAPSLVQVGSDVTFRISLVNPLATPLTGVTINHVLPASFVYKGVGAGTSDPTANGQTLTWSNVTIPPVAQDGAPGIVELIVIATAPNTEGTATSTVTASGGSTPIDQTYNKVDMIIAQLRYLFIPFIGTPG